MAEPALLDAAPATGVTPVPTARPGLAALVGEDLRCVFARDPAARGLWEVATTYPGVHAIVLHRAAHALWAGGWRYAARFLSFVTRALTNVDIHPGARIGRRFFIDHGAGVVIGETAEIGDDVTLYHGVTLGGTSWNKGKRHPTVDHGAVIGAGAKVLGPIRIGAGSRVGANSVVVKDVPPGCTVVGVPGRVIPRRADAAAGAHPDGAIALDHHLLPDPVAKSIACLLGRIDALEAQVRQLRGEPVPADTGRCRVCAAGDLCCEHPRETPAPTS